jgi:glycolate oxidase
VAAVHAAADALIAAALALGGTLTGEHGVGSEKRHYMPVRFSPAELAAQRMVKAAFDPAGLLNPDVLLPAPGPDEPPLPQFAAAVRELVAGRRTGARWQALHPARPAPIPRGAPAADVVVDRETLTVTAAAHLPVSRLHAVLATHHLACAVPRQPEGDATIGAVLGGDPARGALRDSLLAVQVTLPDGEVAQFGSRVLKDVAGYDMKRLYLGSRAQFGQVQQVTLAVRPEPAGAPGGTVQP